MKVSVIIPTYNRASVIGECIESALTQSVEPHEVIVVDDGSTDNTESIVRRYEPRVLYLRQSNQGPSAARNNGAAHASGDLIAFLDSDDVWLKEKLAEQLNYLALNPSFSMVISDMYKGSNPQVHRVSVFASHRDVQEGKIFDCLLRSSYIFPSTVLIRTEVFRRFNGFDESLNMLEDLDLFLKIAKHHEIGVVRSILVFRRNGCGNLSKSKGALLRRAAVWNSAEQRFGPLSVGQRAIARSQWVRSIWGAAYASLHDGECADARRLFVTAFLNGYKRKASAFYLLCSLLPRPVFLHLQYLKSQCNLTYVR